MNPSAWRPIYPFIIECCWAGLFEKSSPVLTIPIWHDHSSASSRCLSALSRFFHLQIVIKLKNSNEQFMIGTKPKYARIQNRQWFIKVATYISQHKFYHNVAFIIKPSESCQKSHAFRIKPSESSHQNRAIRIEPSESSLQNHAFITEPSKSSLQNRAFRIEHKIAESNVLETFSEFLNNCLHPCPIKGSANL